MNTLPPELYLRLQQVELAQHMVVEDRRRAAKLQRQADRDRRRVRRAQLRMDRAARQLARARETEARSQHRLQAVPSA